MVSPGPDNSGFQVSIPVVVLAGYIIKTFMLIGTDLYYILHFDNFSRQAVYSILHKFTKLKDRMV